MNHHLLIVILLGLAAALMPWQFATEVYLFGQKGGPRKAASFVGGITLFRVVLIFVLGMIFVGIMAFVTKTILNLAEFASSFILLLGHEITSGHRVLLDVLLVLSGILLLVEVPLYYRRSKKEVAVEEIEEAAIEGRSARSYLLLGFAWTAISFNQWLFTVTAVNQILAMSHSVSDRVLYSLLFILLASLMILLPFVVYLLQPERAGAILERLSTWMKESLIYLIMLLMAGAGLYLIWLGVKGFYRFVV